MYYVFSFCMVFVCLVKDLLVVFDTNFVKRMFH